MVDSKLKVLIHKKCSDKLQSDIAALNEAIVGQSEGSQASSSAGDKHNTEQAMQHLELEKKHIQLATYLDMQQTLSKIRPEKMQSKVDLGSVVETNKGLFYFSVALGKMTVDNKEIMILSLASPIGQVLKKLKVGESKSFNGNTWEILAIA